MNKKKGKIESIVGFYSANPKRYFLVRDGFEKYGWIREPDAITFIVLKANSALAQGRIYFLSSFSVI